LPQGGTHWEHLGTEPVAQVAMEKAIAVLAGAKASDVKVDITIPQDSTEVRNGA